MSRPALRMALVGGGMFGRDVVLRSLADVQRCGLAPYLGAAGLDGRARDYGDVEFETVAIGTKTAASAHRLAETYRGWVPGAPIAAHHGDAPWQAILDEHQPDILFVATPDHLHTEPILAAIERGVHVVAEKPLTLCLDDARTIVARAQQQGVVVGVDMHKRYDAFLRSAFVDIVPQLGDLLYARAVLEEPLEVSTTVFKWAARSNPFSYVGVHWTDLFSHYLDVKPVALHAVGQKKLLTAWRDETHPEGIDTFDSMQVRVTYDTGLSVEYVNAWVNPADFEGPVNQELDIIGSRGRVFVDQQDRGMRSTITGHGSRTHNPHFQAEVPRAAVSHDHAGPRDRAVIGYSRDSLTAGLEAAARVRLGLSTRAELVGSYPDAESAVTTVALLEAAERVATKNLAAWQNGQGTPVTARFVNDTFQIVEPPAG